MSLLCVWFFLEAAVIDISLASLEYVSHFPGEGDDDGMTVTTTDCVDSNFYCSSWASKGQCHSNPDYMLVYCVKSCGMCSTA